MGHFTGRRLGALAPSPGTLPMVTKVPGSAGQAAQGSPVEGGMVFMDRADAGRRLAARLEYLRGEPVVVLGLPRGGVPVALEVARALGAPLDVIVVRKLGVPFQPELGMGAVGEDGVRVINDEVVREVGVRANELAAVQAREQAQVEARAARYRARRPREPLAGRTAIVVDDGIATGATARAACQVARAHGTARVVLAVPVAPPGWQERAKATPTSWSACRPRSRSPPSGSSMLISPRQPTTKWSPRRPAHRRHRMAAYPAGRDWPACRLLRCQQHPRRRRASP
jgi:predicted phosphoribosyltransferase